VTAVTVLAALIVLAGVIVVAEACMCWARAHDGSMTGKTELIEDIREDLE
jgi:hypothetical protein